MEKKIKFYKNPRRAENEPVEKYVPQYQQLGVEPVQYDAPKHANQIKLAAPTEDNPRLSKPAIRQEYAAPVSPVSFGMLPNVGNNMEHSWSSVDGEIIDDIGFDNSKLIDNNDYVSDSAFNGVDSSVFNPVKEGSLVEDLYGLDEEDYVLIVNGNLICSGSLLSVQEQVKLVVFGEVS